MTWPTSIDAGGKVFTALNRLAATGFHVSMDPADRLAVSPARLLTAGQREWIRRHKPALTAALVALHGSWCVEYPRQAVTADSGTRLVLDCVPPKNWQEIKAIRPRAAVWPAPADLDVVAWIDAGMPAAPAVVSKIATTERMAA